MGKEEVSSWRGTCVIEVSAVPEKKRHEWLAYVPRAEITWQRLSADGLHLMLEWKEKE